MITTNIQRLKMLLLLLCALLSTTLCFARPESTLKGQVTDNNNQPVQYATAQLFQAKNKQLIYGKICNEKGEFAISNLPAGEYLLTVSMVGYTTTPTPIVIDPLKNKTVETKIVMHESEQKLSTVEVSAKKKFIEQTVDKMVITPEASITTASDNVYEILNKLPGVTIDNNDNISLKGKQGVKVMIDDKPTYLTNDQLAAMLKGLQGKNVDKIEIIEKPSARYDAEGNAGIINIKTKHNKAPGYNGSVNGGASFASRAGWNGGIDLNTNYGKFNLYGNASVYDWAGTYGMDATRKYTTTNLAGASQLITNNGHYNGRAYNYKAGADYMIRKNQVLSIMFKSNNGHNAETEDNATAFANQFLQIDSTLLSHSASNSKWANQTYNAGYKWDIDTLGQMLTVDADYAHFNFSSPNTQQGSYFNNQMTNLQHDIAVTTQQGNNIDIYTAKMDYNLPLSKKYTLESGAKISSVRTNSDMRMEGFINQYDHFIYQENILAAYVNTKAQWGKTSVQAGLRLENTTSTGNSVSASQINKYNYLKLFPSLFIQQNMPNDNSLNFSYSYRISRPNYHMLKPFRWMLDPYTYNVGNPYLKPQFTNAFGLGHNYKNMFITNIGYDYTTDMFTQIIRQDDASKTIYQTNENLNSSTDFNLSETVQLNPVKIWRLSSTLTGMYKDVRFTDNTHLDRWSFTGNLTNTVSLPWKFETEISARYQSSMLISNIVIRPRYSIDLGIQRKVLNDNGTIKIAFNDILNTNNSGAYAKNGNVDIDVHNRNDSRRLNISFSYRFGKDKFQTRSNRQTASSDEENRSSK